MVIYHTAPIRCFPLLVEQVAGEFSNPYHFRMPVVARSIEDHRFGMLANLIAYHFDLMEVPRTCQRDNGFPHNLLDNGLDFVDESRRADIDFLYGIFDGRLIKKLKNDFIFTIISHPVTHIYDIFQYLTFVNRTCQGEARYAEGVHHFDGIVADGIERFVDRFLDGNRELVVGDRRFYLIEDLFRFNFTVDYDFVGTETQIRETLRNLARLLDIRIPVNERLLARVSSIASCSRYRMDDLFECLAAEVEAFYAFEVALANSVRSG